LIIRDLKQASVSKRTPAKTLSTFGQYRPRSFGRRCTCFCCKPIFQFSFETSSGNHESLGLKQPGTPAVLLEGPLPQEGQVHIQPPLAPKPFWLREERKSPHFS